MEHETDAELAERAEEARELWPPCWGCGDQVFRYDLGDRTRGFDMIEVEGESYCRHCVESWRRAGGKEAA